MAKVASNKKPYTIHKTDLPIDKDKLKDILDAKGMEYMELYLKTKDKYGLDLSYKGFMSLLSNRSTWKLIYAWAIADVLNIDLKDIFSPVNIDIEKAVKEKEEWKKNYQK